MCYLFIICYLLLLPAGRGRVIEVRNDVMSSTYDIDSHFALRPVQRKTSARETVENVSISGLGPTYASGLSIATIYSPVTQYTLYRHRFYNIAICGNYSQVRNSGKQPFKKLHTV